MKKHSHSGAMDVLFTDAIQRMKRHQNFLLVHLQKKKLGAPVQPVPKVSL